jgi:surface protein
MSISLTSHENFICTNENISERVREYLDGNYNRYPPIGTWDVSRVTNMEEIFEGAYNFNEDISNWNVSNVTTMRSMFADAVRFNKPLNNWNVSNVTTMEHMFVGAGRFNQPLNNWNVSNVTTMQSMFESASRFNQPLDSWNVSNVTTMQSMFAEASKFNQPLNNWDVSNVTNMSRMFENAVNFNQPIDNWNVSNVININLMFKQATSFNQPLNNWNVSNVASMIRVFELARSFNQPLNNWDVSHVIIMMCMFCNAINFNQDLSMWVINPQANVTMMFEGAESMTEAFKPLRVTQLQEQPQSQPQPAIDPYQVHREFHKIDLTKLLDVLAPQRTTTELPGASNFATFIDNSLKDIISQSITDTDVKTRMTNGVNQILTSRISGLNFNDFPSLLREAIYYSLNYIKTLPSDAQKEYIESFVKDCVNAYDGSDGMTCAGGALERIIKSLEVACTSIISSNPESPNAKKCETIIAVLNNDVNKMIQEAILDWYRQHKQGTPGEFPSTMSIQDKKANLREYLISKFPTEQNLIDSKIAEFEMSIGFEHDDFTYGGRKRRCTLRRKYKNLRKTQRCRKQTKKNRKQTKKNRKQTKKNRR